LNQAALTGEALPVEKKAAPASADVQNPLELPCLCFLGSNVESGSATAVVIHTGTGLTLDRWPPVSSGSANPPALTWASTSSPG